MCVDGMNQEGMCPAIMESGEHDGICALVVSKTLPTPKL